jgi:NADH dehydrogenase (ubiquinone) Fe-S protein 3
MTLDIIEKFKNISNKIVVYSDLVFNLSYYKQHIATQCNLLSCISGVDFLGKVYRFCVVYHLLSLKFNKRLKLKVFINEITSLESSMEVYENANWWEREIWDMYGIYFTKHSDLRRILTDYGFDGFPLRKDFPLIGYSEILYNFNKKRIITKPCEFSQEFRFFFFENSWS